jgi:hypothetical protein
MTIQEVFTEIKKIESLAQSPDLVVGSSKSWLSELGRITKEISDLEENHPQIDFSEVCKYYTRVMNAFFQNVVIGISTKEFGNELRKDS